MKPQTKREYLRHLVTEKNHWNRPLTAEEKALGFLGWHERGYLPHCDLPGLVQLLTFRLSDSMPISHRGEWEHLLKLEDDRERGVKLEEYLDRGMGECRLQHRLVAERMETALLFEHQNTYELLAWCVMPNHVHVLVHVWQKPLWKLIAMWKKFVARRATDILRAERRFPAWQGGQNLQRADQEIGAPSVASSSHSAFWQREYWDTFMRDEAQEKTAVRYIENNPVKAKLCRAPNEWSFSSARYRDEFQRLTVPGFGAPIS